MWFGLPSVDGIFHHFSLPLHSAHTGFSFAWLPKALHSPPVALYLVRHMLSPLSAPVSSSLTPSYTNWSKTTPLHALRVGHVWPSVSLTQLFLHKCLDSCSRFAVATPCWNITPQSSHTTCDNMFWTEEKFCQKIPQLCGVTFSICTGSVKCREWWDTAPDDFRTFHEGTVFWEGCVGCVYHLCKKKSTVVTMSVRNSRLGTRTAAVHVSPHLAWGLKFIL